MPNLHDLLHDRVDARTGELSQIHRPDLHRRARRERTRVVATRSTLSALGVGVLGIAAVGGVQLFSQESVPPASQEIVVSDPTSGSVLMSTSQVEGYTPSTYVSLDVYLDPMCPYCGDFTGETLLRLQSMPGAKVTLHPVSFLDSFSSDGSYSTRASSAILEIAASAPEHLDFFLWALWENQPAEGSTLTDDELVDLARTAGVPDDVLELLPEHRYEDVVAQESTTAQDDGIVAVPTVLLDGVEFPQSGVTDPWADLIEAVDEATGYTDAMDALASPAPESEQ